MRLLLCLWRRATAAIAQIAQVDQEDVSTLSYSGETLWSKHFWTDFCFCRSVIFFSFFYAFFVLLGNFYCFSLSVISLWYNMLFQHFVLENIDVLQVHSEPIYILIFFCSFLWRNCFLGKESFSWNVFLLTLLPVWPYLVPRI